MTDALLAIPVLIGLLTLPGSLVLAVWSLAALLPARHRAATPCAPAEAGTLAIVVPAHNEEAHIAHTVHHLLQACQRDGHTRLWVVADNCTDATAQLAASAGAQVLQRHDTQRRGKGHALEFAFRQLAGQGVSWFVVVDADSTVNDGFLAHMRLAMHPKRQALQACYLSRPAHTLKGRLARAAQFGFNRVRLLGRSRLGTSVGLLGNGFALRADTTVQVPYTAHSVAEDLEYHLHLALAGVAVHHVPDARVWGEIAESGTGAPQQRARWEGGRFRMIREWTRPLLTRSLRGKPHLIEPLAELLLLPLGLHAVLLGVAAIGLHPLGLLGTVAGAVAVALYLLAIALRTPVTRADLAALAWAPAYVLWKLTLLPLTLAKSSRQASWVRAERTTPCTSTTPSTSTNSSR